MSELVWPERPTCHDGARFPESLRWRPEDPQGTHVGGVGPYGSPYGYPFKTCGFCGSMSAEDLYRYMTEGAIRFEGADWKYGWPHKFYVQGIPNPKAGQVVGGHSRHWTDDQGVIRDEYFPGDAPAETCAKFYTAHLMDLSDETLAVMAEEMATRTGVTVSRTEDGRLRWVARR